MSQRKRSPLSKRIPRDLRKNCLKYLGMVCILVITIAVGSSFQIVMDGAIQYLEDIKPENLQESGFFETDSLLNEEGRAVLEAKNIRYAPNFYATESEYDGECKILLFDEREELNLPVVFEGELPTKADEIAIDHVFAGQKHLAVGDTMQLLGQSFRISGTVSLPDYSSLFLNNTDLVMNTTHFCVSVVSHEGFAGLNPDTVTYRYSYKLSEEDSDKARHAALAEDMYKELLQTGNPVRSFLRADQNQSISFLEMDIGTDGPFMKVFVYILVAVVAFVFAILTGNTIERESVIIGTLLASGYKKSEIIRHYLQPTLIIAIVGSAIGNILGYTVMIQPFINMYYTTYSIGPLQIPFSVPAFLMTTVLPVFVMIGINYFLLRRKLSLNPLRFLRRDLKKNRQKKARKLPGLSFMNRFRLRVILQNKGSYLLLFVGVFFASFLLMFGIGLKPLMDHYTDSIDRSLPYEYQYLLKAPTEAEGAEKLKAYEMDIWFALGGKDIGVTLMGLDPETKFFKDALPANDDGVTISSAFANKLGLAKGDTFTLKDTIKEKEYEFTVGEVYTYNAGMSVFLSREALNELLGDEPQSYNCLLSEEKLAIDEAYIAKRIARSDLLGAAGQMLDSFGVVIDFINLFSVLVYLIIMYILIRVIIDKNAISISYMKVFGYEKKEIRKVYLSATTFVIVLSLLVCIPLEVGMFRLVLVFLSSMMEGYLEFYLPHYTYVLIVVIGLATYYLINRIEVRNIGRIPMTDALKNRE